MDKFEIAVHLFLPEAFGSQPLRKGMGNLRLLFIFFLAVLLGHNP